MKTRLLIIVGIVLAVVISGAVYATNFENADADDINKGIGTTDVWEPGPTDGFTPTEIPARAYQEAQERPSYTKALSNGSIVLANNSPVLSDKQLDNIMDNLLYSELDRFILPIASIAIDYEADTLVLWTPDLTIGDKVKAVVGDTSFVLLYEEAPPRWEHDGPEPESNSEINRSCMTLEQSKDIAPFFKVPSYLPEGYSMKCSRSGMPSESYIIYHNKDVSDEWIGQMHMWIKDDAIFILQTYDRNIVGEEKFATISSAEQRIQETYDDVMKKNPSLQPQLIRINGMLAYAVDSCPDCGMQTADFPDGTSIQTSTATETKIKFIDENGIKYMLRTTLSLDELILVAESLQ